MFDVVTVHGSDEVRDALLNTVNGWEEWAPLLDARFHRRGAYHIRAGEFDWTALEGNRVVVGAARGEDPWLWHPEDELFVPFYGVGRHAARDLLGRRAAQRPPPVRRGARRARRDGRARGRRGRDASKTRPSAPTTAPSV